MTDPIGKNAGISSVSSDISSGSGKSIQLIFAQLQLELAQTNKQAALDKIDQIREKQQESARMTEAINSLRSLKTNFSDDELKKIGGFNGGDYEAELKQCKAFIEEAKAEKAQAEQGQKAMVDSLTSGDTSQMSKAQANYQESGEYESTMMSTEMENYFKANSIDYASSGVSRRQNAGEWDRAITNLENRAKVLEVADACQEYGVDFPTKDLSKEDIDSMIASLEAVQDELGSDIQQEMVFIQDYMGQYNSYTQGASSAISQASETLKTVARG